MANKQLIKVNEVRASASTSGSLTFSLGSSSIYKREFTHHVKKSELNIAIGSNGSSNLVIREIPVFDPSDIESYKTASQNAKYLHLGAVTINIEVLAHRRFMQNHGKKYKGFLALVDTSFADIDEAIIALMSFDLSQKNSQLIDIPNHYLSLTDPHLKARFSIVLVVEGPKVLPGVELFNICLGTVTTTCNTLNACHVDDQQSNPITNAQSLRLEDIDADLHAALQSGLQHSAAREGCLSLLPAGDDDYIQAKGWKTMFTKKHPMRRRKYVTNNHPSAAPVGLTRSTSFNSALERPHHRGSSGSDSSVASDYPPYMPSRRLTSAVPEPAPLPVPSSTLF
uniref:Movement protein n=1 Tax=Saffron-associated alphaflexivirus TaxID=3125858 RepID=A0AAU6S487_9VIRU